MNALITGIAGFVGPYLAELLIQNRVEVYGTYFEKSELENFDNSLQVSELFLCDLTNENDIATIFDNHSFDLIFHLAAQSSVYRSFQFPKVTFEVNLIGTVNLLEKLRRQKHVKKVIFTSSADVYGTVDPKNLPVNESAPLIPLSPYSISKISCEMICKYYFEAYQTPVVITRGFNHCGPKQTSQFVISDFAKQIAEIEKGKREASILVGNIEAQRDFLDVRDVVKAYYDLAEKGIAGEIYNVSSNSSQSMKTILDQLLLLSSKKIKIVVDQSKIRPTDLPVLVGDNSKLRKTTGWRPEIFLPQTLKDVLNYWREVV